MQRSNSYADINEFLLPLPLKRHINAVYQSFVQWAVALIGCTLGPNLAGKVNMILWRFRGQMLHVLIRKRPTSSKLHFIHAPRTGGTSLKKLIISSGVDEEKIVLHWHGTKLRHLQGAPWFALVRHPIDRLQSCLRRAADDSNLEGKLFIQVQNLELLREGLFDLELLERSLSSRKFTTRLRAYLALNSGGELSEPLTSWFTEREVIRNPPTFVATYNDTMKIKQFINSFFARQPADRRSRYISSKSVPERLSFDTLTAFYAEDFRVFRCLESQIQSSYGS